MGERGERNGEAGEEGEGDRRHAAEEAASHHAEGTPEPVMRMTGAQRTGAVEPAAHPALHSRA
jgi:hypothetical protein